jgi:hypothetical protein
MSLAAGMGGGGVGVSKEKMQNAIKKAAGLKRKQKEALNSNSSLREVIFITLEDDSVSRVAGFVSAFLMIITAVSVSTFLIETDPTFHKKDQHVWFGIEVRSHCKQNNNGRA